MGPGWALVGDAGYNKDFITAQGMQDAFRDAELCATALDQAFSGARPFDDAMGEYQPTRDAQVVAMYEFTCGFATLAPPPPEMQQLLGAVHGNRRAMNGFARLNAGTISPTELFAPDNVDAIFAAADSRARRVGATASALPIARHSSVASGNSASREISQPSMLASFSIWPEMVKSSARFELGRSGA